jgi:hypothetical protein
MCKVLKDFTGHTPFFGEWEEFDRELNAMLLLGHGFVDPRIVKEKKPIVVPFCEQWGKSAMVVQVDKPVKEYFRELIKQGFPHHAITVYGDVRDTLQIFSEQLDLKPCRI